MSRHAKLRRRFCFMPAKPASERSARLQHNAAGRHRLKRIPHGARRIARPQMSHQATHRKCAVSRLTSARLTSITANKAESFSLTFRERSRIKVRDNGKKEAARSARRQRRRLQHNAAGRHRLKRIPHSARPIVTAHMSHQARHKT